MFNNKLINLQKEVSVKCDNFEFIKMNKSNEHHKCTLHFFS